MHLLWMHLDWETNVYIKNLSFSLESLKVKYLLFNGTRRLAPVLRSTKSVSFNFIGGGKNDNTRTLWTVIQHCSGLKRIGSMFSG